MRTKTLLFLVSLIVVTPVTIMAWYFWDSSENRDFEFGYFGEFNRVKHALVAVPGLTITREWKNRDVGLEEFGFDIATESGRTARLDFWESDPVRSMSGEILSRALADKIQKESSPQ